ncbi:hypothetical protein DXG03_004887 [Asterophora parasitica]|uniref:Bud22 domain-containing protein n=1 Tax=Asterophora parasitica TaxID=117018 RepID=A0A9P7KGZ9_9AGAR|nr:hypothetical protein DXG03_004887 [Asterophora parasitica]
MGGPAARRVLKRKRYEPPAQDLDVKIGGKLVRITHLEHLAQDNDAFIDQHHDLKEVKQAAKKAKSFEMQKLIKKLKDLRKKGDKPDEIGEAESHLELLKALDHEMIATTALKTKLNKVRILQENEHVQAAISSELTTDVVAAEPGTSAAKLQSRLLSSKILAAEIATIVEGLRNVMQPKADAVDNVDEVGDEAAERPKKLKKVDGPKEKVPAVRFQVAAGAQRDAGDEGNVDEEIDDAGWESGTVGDDDQEAADGWESGSIVEEDEGDSAEDSDHDSQEPAAVASSSKKVAQPTKATSTKASTKTTGLQSTFLPSLSVGFTRGDSDESDLSDSEVKHGDIEIKKNRRGQRARRAIWEKKFGRNANHKKKEAEEQKDSRHSSEHRHQANAAHSSHGSFNKAPARKQSEGKAVPQYRQEADSGWSQRAASQNSAPDRPAPPARSFGRVEEKPLHPSWEAKKKMKEKQSAGIVPSQGKKITF